MPSAKQLPQVILPDFDAAMLDAANKRLTHAQLFVINTDADYEAASDTLKDLTAFERMAESGMEQSLRPLNEAVKKIRGLWKPTCEIATKARTIMKRHISDYLAKKEAEQRKLQLLADERAAKERARLEARAVKEDAKGNVDKAAAIAQQAALTVAPVVRTELPKISGQSVREAWCFQIEDASQIPREFLAPDEVKIRKYVNAMKAEARIAGVRIYSEKRIASGV
jgi:hypothetical protein